MDGKEKMEVPSINPDDLPDGIDELKRRCAKLELDNAILEQTIDILKKDPGVDPSELSNREKMMAIDALKGRLCASALCGELGVSRSSYYCARAAGSRPDPHREVRARIRAIFARSRETFGFERVWPALRNGDDSQEPIRVSEKVAGRIMAEEGLRVIYARMCHPTGSPASGALSRLTITRGRFHTCQLMIMAVRLALPSQRTIHGRGVARSN